MPVSFDRATALQIIANEKMGFSFGVPERPDENSLAVVLPILRSTSVKRHYITLPETKDVQIADTGSINKMRFTNKTSENVFVRSGTMLKGSTQERAITRSAILFPGSTVELECRCIHQTRGIQHNATVNYSGITPLKFDQMNYRASYAARSQSDYWSNAESFTSCLYKSTEEAHARDPRRPRIPRRSRALRPRAASLNTERLGLPPIGDFVEDSAFNFRQDDLASNFDEFSKTFADLLAKVKLHRNQVGLGLITDKACETIELFDLDQSWKAMHEDAVKRVGSDVAKPDLSGVFEYKQEKAVEAVKKVLGVGFDQKVIYEHRASNGEPSVAVIGLSNEKYTGEIVELDGRVMHLVLLRMVNA